MDLPFAVFVTVLFFWVGGCFAKLHKHIPMQNNLICKVISLNVRGIRDQAKRRSIFSYLKDQKASIYFLQETYSETKQFGKTNGVVKCIFPMGLDTAKALAY